jgi:hypothetical protein
MRTPLLNQHTGYNAEATARAIRARCSPGGNELWDAYLLSRGDCLAAAWWDRLVARTGQDVFL